MKNSSEHIGYQFYRSIGTPTFKILYHPTIINAEYIPESGPIILCGNHLHVWDQFPVVCSTKRTIHWMSKKEYFEGKLAPFFKTSGCIPVDRQNNPTESKNIAMDYLNNGSAIGIFPEGTRNKFQAEKFKFLQLEKMHNEIQNQLENYVIDEKAGIKQLEYIKERLKELSVNMEVEKSILESRGYSVNEEDMILPFKYGTVSMAKKTNAQIVPFAVTGDYTVNNKNLVVSFGKPFYVEDDLEKTNEKLMENVKQLIKNNINKKF